MRFLVVCVVVALLLAWGQAFADSAVQLTTDPGEDRWPNWSPDGSMIAFASDRLGSTRDIWVMSSAGGGETSVVVSSDDIRGPEWSPDGNWLTFDVWQTDRYKVFKAPSTGGGMTLVYNPGLNPDWSPDGTLIAFRNTSGDIAVVPPSGGTPTTVTTDGHLPDWSPDGSTIAFMREAGGGDMDIWTVPSTGGTPFLVTTSTTNDRSPAWSPDGSKIAFNSDLADPGGQHDIWVIPATGGTPIQITDEGGGNPHWSPDGTKIVFSSLRSGNSDIWVIDVGGASATEGSTWGRIKGMFR
jgi:Tol biopolymer transport system component